MPRFTTAHESHGPYQKFPRLLTAKEASGNLSISKRKLWSLTKSGEIPCVRIDRLVRYTEADLNTFIQNSTQGGSR